MYSSINQTKWGDCSQCPATNVACVKVKKDLVCTNCHNKNKTLEQIDRQKKRIAARNATSKIAKIEGEDSNREMAKGYAELDRFFKEMQKRMTGRCENCGGKTEAFTKHFKNSIAHILPKAYFKSVATNENNWLELCFYGNSCHSNYDNKMLDLIDMNCFDTIIQKFTKIYPHIAADEKRRIPPILIEYLKTEI